MKDGLDAKDARQFQPLILGDRATLLKVTKECADRALHNLQILARSPIYRDPQSLDVDVQGVTGDSCTAQENDGVSK